MTVDTCCSFGGLIIRVISPRPLADNPIFRDFECRGANADLTYVIHDIGELCERGDNRSLTVKRSGDVTDVWLDTDYLAENSLGSILSSVNAAHHVISKDAFVLHSSHVKTESGAILFCAPSGTGKSTQARFWNAARGTLTVNEDRTLVRRVDGEYIACGCWTKGSGTACFNVTENIRALVLLSQSDKNSVRQPAPSEILRRVVPECTFDEKDTESRRAIIDLVTGLIGKVRTVALDCVNDISSVDELERYV